jgi:voltage-gated potassium channel
LGRVVKKEQEPLLATLGIMFILLIMTASLLYFAERETQPHLFESIPQAMWWGISALVKVPLGQGFPITIAGRLLGSILALMGVALFALPAGILGSAFLDDLRRRNLKQAANKKDKDGQICPHCGQSLKQHSEAPSPSPSA